MNHSFYHFTCLTGPLDCLLGAGAGSGRGGRRRAHGLRGDPLVSCPRGLRIASGNCLPECAASTYGEGMGPHPIFREIQESTRAPNLLSCPLSETSILMR